MKKFNAIRIATEDGITYYRRRSLLAPRRWWVPLLAVGLPVVVVVYAIIRFGG